MLIELESVYGDKTIHGKYLNRSELQNALNEILRTVEERDFPSIFCARYGYEEVPHSDSIQVDYVIDLDTHLLIKPKYQ